MLFPLFATGVIGKFSNSINNTSETGAKVATDVIAPWLANISANFLKI
jgi:hypothetical protein